MNSSVPQNELDRAIAENLASVIQELAAAAAAPPADPLKSQRDLLVMQLITVRQREKLSQAELATKTGLPQSTISRLESGKGNPRLSTLLKITAALEQQLMLRPAESVKIEET